MRLIYHYCITYFCANSKEIIDLIRQDKNTLTPNEAHLVCKFRKEFEEIRTEELYFLIQQPLMQTDLKGIDNLLWLFSLKKKSTNIELLR